MKIQVNTVSMHLKLAPEVVALLKLTGEPTGYVRELIMKSLNITEDEIKRSRKAIDNTSDESQV